MKVGVVGVRLGRAAGGGAQCDRGVVGSGRGRRGRRGRRGGRRGRRGGGGRALRAVRAPLLQRVQPAPARAPHPRGAAGGVRHVRALLQDAAVPAPAHARAAPRAPQAAADTRAAARAPLAPRALTHHPHPHTHTPRTHATLPHCKFEFRTFVLDISLYSE